MLKKALLATVSASILLGHSLLSFPAHAQLTSAEEQAVKAQINQKLGLTVSQVQEAPMEGLYELITEAGLFYSDKKGEFFIQGKLYGLSGNVVNHSETTLAQMRIDGMAKFTKDMIIYFTENEEYRKQVASHNLLAGKNHLLFITSYKENAIKLINLINHHLDKK